MKKEVIDLLQSHRSTRRFRDKLVSQEILEELFEAARWATSSHNVQAYSIIVVESPENKKEISKLCGNQKWIENCPVFLVFCTDFYRLKQTTEMHQTNLEIREVENVLVGAVDTALAAENVLIAAKSFGLGGVMIGGIRNHPKEISDLLNLPDLVMPIMGMCLGYPAQENWQKPRLPKRTVVHYENYNTDKTLDGLKEYEAISADYYTKRTNGKRTEGWTKQMADYLSEPRRPHLKEFMEEKGFQFK
jgi:nitroreductase